METGIQHQMLCDRALRWLSGNRRCNPVFAGIASCSEVPDAIGWSSSYKHRGSIVVECKVSAADFYADKKKAFVWRDPAPTHSLYGDAWQISRNYLSNKAAKEAGYIAEEILRMGDYRFYLCPPGMVTEQMIEKHAPDHGLLYVESNKVKIIREAPRREKANYPAEIRYLRFAIINNKVPHESAKMETE